MRVSTLMLIACTLVVGVLGGDEMKAKHRESVKKCLTETGLEETDMKEIFKREGEPTQKIKCFHGCMAKEMGTLVDGNFVKDKIIQLLPADLPEREKVVEVMTKCSAEKGSDDCETAYLGFKCLRDNKVLPPPPPQD